MLVLPTAGGLDSSIDSSRTSTTVQIDTEAQVAGSALVAAAAAKGALGHAPGAHRQHLGERHAEQRGPRVHLRGGDGLPGAGRRPGHGRGLPDAALGRRPRRRRTPATKALTASRSARAREKDFDAERREIGSETRPTGAERRPARELTSLVAQISDINSRLVALGVTTTEGGQVISAAQLPAAPISPILWVDLAAGLLIGGLAGSGILLLDRRRHGRVRGRRPAGAGPARAARHAGRSRCRPRRWAHRPRPRRSPHPTPSGRPAPSVDLRPTDEPAAPHVSHDAGTGFEVLASLVLDGSGPVAEGQQAALRALSAEVSKAGTHDGPVVLVGVDYPGLDGAGRVRHQRRVGERARGERPGAHRARDPHRAGAPDSSRTRPDRRAQR